uniref:DNA-directed RNA polymerase subunit beta n=1 Tax=Pyramimonas parkeae TaxID=36894 RepID=A0A1R7T0V5_9CHLO|nr:beta subunit of RNA polymerase [Pyramimonas parkeae]
MKKMTKDFKLPDLVGIQRESFFSFLEKGFKEEIQRISPICCENETEKTEIYFYANEVEWRHPSLLPQEAIFKSLTYSTAVYIPLQIFSFPHEEGIPRKSKRQKVFLGEIPLMTGKGTFIINGSSRVIVNQIVRSAGIYYKPQLDKDNNKTYLGSILSNRGSWLRFETDKNALVWVKIDKIRKIPIFVFLYALGLTQKQINESLRHSTFLNKSLWKQAEMEEEEPPTDQKSALLKLHFKLRPDRPGTLRSASDLLESRFMNPNRYDLGKLGRIRLNKKLRILGNPTATVLRPEDILAAVDYLVNLEFGMGKLDDIDDLKNRRIRTSGELIQNQIRIGFSRLEKMIREKITEIEPINGLTIAESFLPTRFIHPKPMVGSLREFFGSSQLSQYMDQTNPLAEITHKRRLSSLGPGGLSKDRAGMAVREIHPSHYGRICPIETPEGGNAGLVSSLTTYAKINSSGFLECPFYRVHNGEVKKKEGPYFLSAEQEENTFVSPGDLFISNENKLSQEKIPTRYKKEFGTSSPKQVQFIGISPIQMISVATSLIPFLEHDDANRVLMGSNMQRQAVPILSPERPLVGTGLEGQVARDSGTVLLSKKSGLVISTNSEEIHVAYSKDSKDYIIHPLQRYQRSNQATCISQRPSVCVGDWVQEGDLLADGAATSRGELALGKNVLVAYMPWEGYNFEDAILISERLVSENIYTSIHIERYEVEARQTKIGMEVFTRNLPHVENELTDHLDENGLVLPGSWVEGGDILVGKITPKGEFDQTPEKRLLRAIFQQKEPDVQDSSLRVPNGVKGRVIYVRPKKNTVRIFLAEKRKIQVGDKIAGRHGNKGIVSNILPIQDMPFLQDGTPVDMVLNPLGVPSRMNVGQVFECLLGLAGKYLNQSMKVIPFDEMYGKETSRGLVYRKLYEARRKTKKKWLFEPSFAGKTRLFDGRTGEVFDQPVLTGYPYMLKLVHLVDDKIHARSTGPYSLVTQQPLGGRAKHGGQRLGEMEVWALEGYGAAYLLQELLTVKSDDMQGRNDILHAIIKGGTHLPQPGCPESFKVLISELRSLCLDIRIY